MAERRLLSNALSTNTSGVDAELVRTFVTQNFPSERPVGESALTPETVDVKRLCQKSKTSNRLQPVGLIPVTVRLRPEIAGALKRASLERELAGECVFTQQAIVEEALEPWLSGGGFLD